MRTSAYGDEKDWVAIKSDGTPGYFAGDCAYMARKLARGFDRLIYVLGADHHGYVGRLRALAAMFGRDPESVEVLLYQLVHLTRGGEQTKMSKRRGDVVFLDEFMDEIGVDAARWYLVSRGHDQTIEIDVDLAAEKSQKNPVYYVQYAHARIAGILRNAGRRGRVGGGAGRPGRGGAGADQAARRVPGASRPRRPSGGPRTRSPPTRSASPTTSTASTTSTRCSAARRRRSGSGSARRRGSVIARCLDLIGVEAPDRM